MSYPIYSYNSQTSGDPLRLIALSGFAGSGKSLASSYFEGAGYRLVKFAAPVKDMLRILLHTAGLSRAEIEACLEGELKEEPLDVLQGASPRKAMQTLGQDWGRDMIHPDIWLDLWRSAVLSEFSLGHKVVVDDLRYLNEVQAVNELGGLVYHVRRSSPDRPPMDHLSERFDFTPDHIIDNDGTKEEFLEQLRVITL